ncbi:MAG: hypothetical protein MPJ24_03900 [Pirellulaceae bacterium]|nr:hypothetical protein [Pirellulaceae bacterium]
MVKFTSHIAKVTLLASLFVAAGFSSTSPAYGQLFPRLYYGPNAPVVAVPSYRLQPQIVYQQRPVTTYRQQLTTVMRPEEVTVRRPVWTTEMRERRYKVAKPVLETSTKEETYKVLKPVYETSEKEYTYDRVKYVNETSTRSERTTEWKEVFETSTRREQQIVRQPVTETVWQDQYQVTYKPVTTYQNQVVNVGGVVQQQVQVPGKVRNRLQRLPGQAFVDPATGQVVQQRGGLYWVPYQRPGQTYTVNQYVPQYVQQQRPVTTYQQQVVTQKVPTQVTHYVDKVVTRDVPVQVRKLVPQEVVREVPVTVQRPIIEKVTYKVPEKTVRWVEETMVRKVPVTTQRYVYEEKVEKVPVRVLKYVNETQTVMRPVTVSQMVPQTTMQYAPQTVWARHACGVGPVSVETTPFLQPISQGYYPEGTVISSDAVPVTGEEPPSLGPEELKQAKDTNDLNNGVEKSTSESGAGGQEEWKGSNTNKSFKPITPEEKHEEKQETFKKEAVEDKSSNGDSVKKKNPLGPELRLLNDPDDKGVMELSPPKNSEGEKIVLQKVVFKS